jgi:hypothetical protein
MANSVAAEPKANEAKRNGYEKNHLCIAGFL